MTKGSRYDARVKNNKLFFRTHGCIGYILWNSPENHHGYVNFNWFAWDCPDVRRQEPCLNHYILHWFSCLILQWKIKQLLFGTFPCTWWYMKVIKMKFFLIAIVIFSRPASIFGCVSKICAFLFTGTSEFNTYEFVSCVLVIDLRKSI